MKDRLQRVPFTRPVHVQWAGAASRARRMLAGNLSLGGMFVRSNVAVAPGTKLSVALEARGRALPFAEAEVIWSSDPSQPTPPGRLPGFGLRFLRFLHPRAPALLDFLVRRPAAPAPEDLSHAIQSAPTTDPGAPATAAGSAPQARPPEDFMQTTLNELGAAGHASSPTWTLDLEPRASNPDEDRETRLPTPESAPASALEAADSGARVGTAVVLVAFLVIVAVGLLWVIRRDATPDARAPHRTAEVAEAGTHEIVPPAPGSGAVFADSDSAAAPAHEAVREGPNSVTARGSAAAARAVTSAPANEVLPADPDSPAARGSAAGVPAVADAPEHDAPSADRDSPATRGSPARARAATVAPEHDAALADPDSAATRRSLATARAAAIAPGHHAAPADPDSPAARGSPATARAAAAAPEHDAVPANPNALTARGSPAAVHAVASASAHEALPAGPNVQPTRGSATAAHAVGSPPAHGAKPSAADRDALAARGSVAPAHGVTSTHIDLKAGGAEAVSISRSGRVLIARLDLAPGAEIERTFVLSGPSRAVIDLRGPSPRSSVKRPSTAPIVEGVRVGARAGGTRVVLDLSAPASAAMVVNGTVRIDLQ
ncbi:MAG: AMIN domain-containing protein [Myxococcaceae bacterium]|nr:AMIN domain-containing protein [Myxococcaceae bacterium]